MLNDCGDMGCWTTSMGGMLTWENGVDNEEEGAKKCAASC